ncbi:MAG: YfcC family protein [Clostridium sp.]|nr:YfcC family protein [Clostridium sp.]
MEIRNEKSNGRWSNFKVPHTLAIITMIMILVAIATYLVPAGQYDKVVNEAGKTVVVDGSFKYVERTPQGIFELLQAPVNGLIEGAEIIAFLFAVGGAFSLIAKTKAIDFGIVRVVKKFKGREILIIPILVFIFSLGGAVFGMSEEAIPFVTILSPLMLVLGYDSIVTVAITYFSCILGFSSAMLNPFTVGVAQSIAELQPFSGVGYRTIIWFTTTTIGALFIMFYATKIKKNPKSSLVYESDEVKRKNLINTDTEKEEFTLAHKMILITLAASIGIVVWGVLSQGFWIPEIAAVFVGAGFLSALLGKLNVDEMSEAFIEGAKGMVGAAVMLGFAKGIVILAQNSSIIDTTLNALSSVIGGLPALVAAWIMYPIQMFINFFVNSGSGQAALTVPILAPLGDLIGISRQLTVLIFQLGDGFSNALFPTSGVLLACLGIAGVPYSKWLKWIIPIQSILFVSAILFITIGHLMGWS